MSFGEELRARRIRARLTQRELAQRAGVSIRAVRYIEQGKVTRPRRDSLRRLGDAVGLSTEAVVTQRIERLRIGVLGPLELTYGGRPVDGGTLKQRSLLGLLALQPNKVISWAEIIDVLWGEAPPESCHNLVHTYASRLRKLIAPVELMSCRSGGYQLNVDGDTLDLLRFNELAAGPRSPDALRRYERALRCWRGRILEDLPANLRQHPAAVAVAGRRLSVALDYADLAVEHGSPGAELIEQLRLLADEEPLHEGLHARLALALATSGQQAAALGLLTQLRGRLDAELGVQPGAEIRAAYLRIITSQPEVDRRPVSCRPTWPGSPGGRNAWNGWTVWFVTPSGPPPW